MGNVSKTYERSVPRESRVICETARVPAFSAVLRGNCIEKTRVLTRAIARFHIEEHAIKRDRQTITAESGTKKIF